ncbi:MAG TPA: radical SAM protein, partial [Candidatus Nitrosotalea sp.]|nr:radical SAM protein [Candidatus Nitrosotalea sp.]
MKDPMIVDWLSMLEQAYDLGCRKVQFIGGEPMYNPYLTDYVIKAHDLGFDFIEVYSNLTMLNTTMLDTFFDCKVNIATSFYSRHKEVHDLITGVKGSFEKTIEGIDKVLARGLPLRVGIIKMEVNEADVKETIEFLVRRGVNPHEIRSDKTRPVGRGGDLTPSISLEETLCGKCWQGKLCITSYGGCYPCVFARHLEVGNASSQSLMHIVKSQRLLNTRKLIYKVFRNYLTRDGVRVDDDESSQCAPDCAPLCTPERPCSPVCGPSCEPA